MANYAIQATQLREGQVVLVKGTLTFSRLARLVEGEDLARSDAQRIANGMQPVGKPHTSINLANAEVVHQSPANPTVEEQFVTERRYTSKKHPEHGQCYSLDNKSERLPVVAKLNEHGQAEQIQLQGELAAGVPVIMVLRVFKPRNYANRGLSLDQVIIQDTKVEYYSAGATNEALAAAGIVFATPPVPQQAAPAFAATSPAPAANFSNDPQIAAAQAAGAWPTPGSNDAPAAPQATSPQAPVEPESIDPYRSTSAPVAQAPAGDDIEALKRKLAEAEAAAAQKAAGSPFQPAAPITYQGE